MSDQKRIYFAQIGKPVLALHATIEESEDPTDPAVLRFQTHIEEYRGYFPRRLRLATMHVLLFDGQILEHGLPTGARVIDYEYSRSSDKLSSFGTKHVRTIALSAQTVRRDRSGVPKEHALYERVVVPQKGQTYADLTRTLLLLPHGSVSLGFRIRPQNLKRQYVTIHSDISGVTLRSVVN